MTNNVSNETISAVKASYGRCLNNPEFFDDFYDQFLSSNSEIRQMFANTDFDKQKTLIKHGLNMMIAYASGSAVGQSVLKRIRESHSQSQMGIRPEMYRYWLKSLTDTVAQHDPQFDASLKNSWEETLAGGIEFISAGYTVHAKSA